MIKIYQNNKLKLEDLYKATEYLSVFHRFKHKMVNKDINTYTNLPELFKVVEPYLEREEFVFTNDAERKLAGQFKEVFRGNKHRIIIPLTLKASQYFGRDTEWCTLNTDQFKKYTENQDADVISYKNLYILYTEDLDERFQFHFEEMQFMNIYDEEIDLPYIYKKYPDIEKFFSEQEWFKYIGLAPNEYIKIFLEENGYDKDDIKMFDSEFHDGFQISIEEIFTVNSDKILFEDIEKFFVDKPLKNYKIDNFKDDANNNEDGLYMIGITFFI